MLCNCSSLKVTVTSPRSHSIFSLTVHLLLFGLTLWHSVASSTSSSSCLYHSLLIWADEPLEQIPGSITPMTLAVPARRSPPQSTLVRPDAWKVQRECCYWTGGGGECSGDREKDVMRPIIHSPRVLQLTPRYNELATDWSAHRGLVSTSAPPILCLCIMCEWSTMFSCINVTHVVQYLFLNA